MISQSGPPWATRLQMAAVLLLAILALLEWMGLRLDETANAINAAHLSTPDSRVQALVIPTDEELMIALHTLRVAGGDQAAPSARWISIKASSKAERAPTLWSALVGAHHRV